MMDRYRILRPLESGQEVRVYLLEDQLQSGSRKVLTLLPKSLSSRGSRILLEQLLADRNWLSHPCLVQVEDVAFRGQRVGIVSELLEGQPLTPRLICELNWEERCSVALQLTELLVYLHRRNHVCGLIKPAYCYFVPKGRIRLNFLLEASRLQKCANLETIRFSSPELLTGGKITLRSDLYSLGLLLYQIFTGSEPFSGTESEIVREKQLMTRPVRPRVLNPDIPPLIEELILDLTRKEPALRPDTSGYALTVLLELGVPIPDSEYKISTPLLGRDPEIHIFRQLLEKQRKEPRARVVVVSGAAGIGKSRLMERFRLIAKLSLYFRVSEVTWFDSLDCMQNDAEDRNPSVHTDYRHTEKKADPKIPDPVDLAPRIVFLEGLGNHSRKGLYSEPIRGVSAGKMIFDLNEEDLLVCDIENRDYFFIQELHSSKSNPPAEYVQLELKPLELCDLNQIFLRATGHNELQLSIESLLPRCNGNPYHAIEWFKYLERNDKASYKNGLWEIESGCALSYYLPAKLASEVDIELSSLDDQDTKILLVLAITGSPLLFSELSAINEVHPPELDDRLSKLDQLSFITVSGSLSNSEVSLPNQWLRGILLERYKAEKVLLHKKLTEALLRQPFSKLRPSQLYRLAVNLLEGCSSKPNPNRFWRIVERLQYLGSVNLSAQLLERAIVQKTPFGNSWKRKRLSLEILLDTGRTSQCVQLCDEFLTGGTLVTKDELAIVNLFKARALSLVGQIMEAKLALEHAFEHFDLSKPCSSLYDAQAQLLYCLPILGEINTAEKLCKRLLGRLAKVPPVNIPDRLYHFLSFYALYVKGDDKEFFKWEMEAIISAETEGKFQSFLGRLSNIASVYVDWGEFETAKRISNYIQKASKVLNNRELEENALLLLATTERLTGAHKKARKLLYEIQQVRIGKVKNSLIAVETNLELALNALSSLYPERALGYLEVSQALAQQTNTYSTHNQLGLAQVAAWVQLGELDKADRKISEINSRPLPREVSQISMLMAERHLASGCLKKALYEAESALGCMRLHMSYQRAAIFLLRGEILLELNRLEQAGNSVQTGLAIARDEFYLPYMARGFGLYARYLLAAGKAIQARVYSLRSLQLANHVERPGLKAELLTILGDVEAGAGQVEKAFECYGKALQILKERLLQLSPQYREGFGRRFVEPVESRRRALVSEASRPSMRYLVELRRMSSEFQESASRKELAEKAVRLIAEAIPGTSGNFYLREAGEGPLRLMASRGRCRRSGRHLFPSFNGAHSDRISEDDHSDGSRSRQELGVPIKLGNETVGLMYLEKKGVRFPEDALDFLICIAGLVELRLAGRFRPVTELEQKAAERFEFGPGQYMIGNHPAMRELYADIRRIAPSPATVLIYGESGTGKELVARALHHHSGRREGPFIPVNCSAIPTELVENEFFGHCQGSFTGATREKKGLIEQASGGTLFLDEIATMPLEIQGRLLRVLQDRKVRRLGDTRETPVSVRFIAATNQLLQELVRSGRFRADLFHRLNVCLLEVPPLRDRQSDIPQLASHFLEVLGKHEQVQRRLDSDALSHLRTLPFPGNVRELQNLIERAFYLSTGPEISIRDFPASAGESALAWRESPSTFVDEIYEKLVAGRIDFWTGVRDLFLRRDLSRRQMRAVISKGLAACDGNYRDLLDHFRMPQSDYKRFLAFLTHYDCKVDFRPYRKRIRRSGQRESAPDAGVGNAAGILRKSSS